MIHLVRILAVIAVFLTAVLEPGRAIADETPWFRAMDPVSGNWRVTLNPGTDGERAGTLGIRPKTRVICEEVEAGGCIQRIRYDKGPDRVVAFREGDTFGEIAEYSVIGSVQAAGGQIRLNRRWMSWSWDVVLQSDGGTGYRGTWTDGTSTGEEIWQALRPNVDRLGASTYTDAIFDGSPVELVEPGTALAIQLRAKAEYDWSDGRETHRNRPKFRIYLYGTNLEGPQHITFPNSPDFEVLTQRRLLSQPDADGERHQIGLRFDVVMWPHARAGRHLLRINDKSHEVVIEMQGDPGVDFSKPTRKFVIGDITMDVQPARNSDRALRQALSEQLGRAESARRSLARVETDLLREEAIADAAIDKAVQDFKARAAAGEIDTALIASEQALLDHRIRSYLGPVAALQSVYDAALKTATEADAALSRLRQKAETHVLAGLPHLERVETDHARFERSGDLIGELARLDAGITEVTSLMQDAVRLRTRLQEQLVLAVKAANKAATELSDTQERSYYAQAMAQGVVQTLDLAVASEGNPYVFVGGAAVQIASNIWIAPPEFSDGETDDLVKVIDIARSAAAAFLQEGATRGLDHAVQTWGAKVGIKAVDIAERRAIGRWLAAISSPDDDTPFVRSFLRGVALSSMTEKLKEQIARDIVEEELAAYGAAQSRVSLLVTAIEIASQTIEDDRKWLDTHLPERARLARIQSGNAPTLRHAWPTLLTVRNDAFTPMAGYMIELEFDAAPAPFDVYLAGVRLSPTASPQRFVLDAGDVDKLLTGRAEALPLRIVQTH